jgi:hypothetical protein
MTAASSEVTGWTNDQGAFAGVLLCLADGILFLLSQFLTRAITEHLLRMWPEAHRIHGGAVFAILVTLGEKTALM